jgi:hypothetical protein
MALITDTIALTGGTLLRILTGDTWTPEDIDLATMGDPPGLPCVRSYANLNYSTQLLNAIFIVPNASPMIQYLCVNDTVQYARTFDLAFCRNIFDAGKLVVCSPFAVLRRQCELNVDSYYYSRNLELVLDHMTHAHMPSRFLRLRKYIHRGFDVTLLRTFDDPDEMSEQTATPIETCNLWITFWNQSIDPDGQLRDCPPGPARPIPDMYYRNT